MMTTSISTRARTRTSDDLDASTVIRLPEVEALESPIIMRQLSVDSLSLDEVSMENEDNDPLDNVITKKETKDVLQLKILVLSILVISACTIATCMFLYITRGETKQFEAQFNNDAAKLLDGVVSSLHRTLGLLDSLAVTYVSYAQSQNHTWPFVTLPHFGARMAKILPLSDAIIITLLPIVYPEKRKEWEEYSLKNDQWVNQSIALQETWSGFHGKIEYSWEPRGVIYDDDGEIEANTRHGTSKVISSKEFTMTNTIAI
jgi:hypothetical protein